VLEVKFLGRLVSHVSSLGWVLFCLFSRGGALS
jgi:hypothetical protein